MTVGKEFDIATRAQALALLEEGVSLPRIIEVSKMSRTSIFRIRQLAYTRGYDPAISRQIKDEYVATATRSGRPCTITAEQKEEVLKLVQEDRAGREKTTAQLGLETGMSAMSAWQTLKAANFRWTKPSWKPGLTEEMKKARLQFALRYQH